MISVIIEPFCFYIKTSYICHINALTMNDLRKIHITIICCTLVLIFVMCAFLGIINAKERKTQKALTTQLMLIQSDLKQANVQAQLLHQNIERFTKQLNDLNKAVQRIDSSKKVNDNLFLTKQSQLQKKISQLDAEIDNFNLIILE